MEEIIIDGLDEIEMQNTAVDDIDSENVNLIFIGIDKSGSMSPYRGDMVSCLKEFKQALTDSKEADEILVARADFNSSINVGGYKKITEFDTNYDASGMTALYNVIEDGTQKLTDYMEYLKQQGVRVKAVFAIFSDGEDTVSNDPSEAKRRIQDLNNKEITTACVGYICGYLRYYYPLEFLTAALNTFEGKEEKTLNITNYTKKKGIKVEGVKFRHSTSEYTFNKEENVIYKGIASIKYLNSKVADAFQSIKDMEFQDFIHLLAVVKEKSLPVNSKQMKILIQLNFFEEFGEVKYLLKQYDYFDLLYGKKQMKKDKADSLGIPYEIIKRNSEKESEKTFTKVNMMGVLHDYINVMPYDRTTFVDRVGYQLENLGYIDIVDNQYKGYVVVLETETKYTPKVKVYALANGNTLTVKVAKKDFNRNPLQKGDIVHITNQKKKARMKMSAEGKFVPVEGEFDWWATKYEMVGK